MHAILVNLGTDGDILPFIGLGTVLRTRGHRVTIVAAENYSGVAADHLLEFRELLSKAEMEELLGNPDFWHPLKTVRLSAKWGARLIEPQFQLLKEIAGNDDVILISNPAIFAAAILSDKFGYPLIHIVLQPWMIPSAIAPPLIPVIGPPSWFPPFAHRTLFRLIDVFGDKFLAPGLNDVRRSQNLPPVRRILSNWFSKTLILGMFPPWFGPPQEDWPKQTKLVGFPHFDAATQRALPGKILDFITRKKPTVIFTFGSGMMHAKPLFEAVEKICADLNVQGLLISRFFTPEKLPATMMHVPFLPFRELFPHCAAVVHHGGIGTTAEALACGIPQLICPLGFDQLDNGARVARLGAGLHTRSKHNLVPNHARLSPRDQSEITTALQRLLDGEFRENCAAIAQKMARADDALQLAADHVERVALCDSPRRR